MKSTTPFSKKPINDTVVNTGSKNRSGFTPNVMVSKVVAGKPVPHMAGRSGNKSQIGGMTPGAKGAPGSKGRKVHAAQPVAAFSKKKV